MTTVPRGPGAQRAGTRRLLVRAAHRLISRSARLSGLRDRAAAMLVSPAATPTVFALELAEHYPSFRRGYDNESDAVKDIRFVRPYTMTKYDRCVVLHGLVRHLERTGVSGAFVECGVWRGGSSGLMALANLRYAEQRRAIHLFDAWDEWPDPTPEDGNRFDDLKQGRLLKADNTGALAAAQHLLEDLVRYPSGHLHYHRGLFEDTLPDAVNDVGPVALLRIDSDWYEPTRLCLEFLYRSVVPGGIVVFDDYGYCDGARRAVDTFLARADAGALLHFADYSCRYIVRDRNLGR